MPGAWTEVAAGEPIRWFGRTDKGIGIAPLTWQGRTATALYVFLVLVAVVTYSKLSLTVGVIVFYTVVFILLVALKSDLLQDFPPGRRDPPGPEGPGGP